MIKVISNVAFNFNLRRYSKAEYLAGGLESKHSTTN
jgi:hypothetical protein